MADTPQDDPYERLGVARDATKAAIKKAYRSAIKVVHPDSLAPDTSEEDRATAAISFAAIQTAYDTLSDPVRRAKYDETGEIDLEAESSLHERALAQIVDIFFTIVEGSEFPETKDLMSIVGEQLAERKTELANNTHLTRQKMRKYQRVVNRIRTTRDDDPLTRGCGEIIEGMRRHLEEFEEQREVLTLSTKMLEDFNFDWIMENPHRYKDDVRRAALLDARLLALPGAQTE